jgi:phage shock protein PspC (stress-responsive transcriptional regulator)
MEEKQEKSLSESVAILTKLAKDLKSRRYLQRIDNPKKFFFYNFISGIVRGIGVAFGASIVFALILWILSKLQIVPILGDWAIVILDYIEKMRGY